MTDLYVTSVAVVVFIALMIYLATYGGGEEE